MSELATHETSAASFALSAEQEELRSRARALVEREGFAERSLEWEQTGEFPWANVKALAGEGLLATTIPVEHGGNGGSWMEGALVLEEIARACWVTAMASLGEIGVQSQALAAYGSDEVRAKYLPQIASGDLICSVCITEEQAGSDIFSMSTIATDDPDSGEVVVNGGKALISRGDVAGLFVVYVRWSQDPGMRPIGAVLIPRDTPGLTIDEGRETLGGEKLYALSFDTCRIPASYVLARENGFKKMLTAFNGQRCLNAAISVGLAQGAQDAAVAYVKQRVQGGKALAEHQGIQWMIADNEIEIQSARQLVWRAAAAASGGFPNRHDAAIAKVVSNEMALRVTDRVVQLFGGHGWLKEFPAERFLRWARYGPLGGGTPQIQRTAIAREVLK
ncbi:acyl-CoA dehydrogenase family protein [Conexibacter sp. CPCC 206217]|uniref:acyl-CoA dehydrogenase family protein n=1 Tax=Conexibacter sp. CPCC 206217 TaxID=3064574 RepID=UPI00271B53C9|nr:acyl-CoA dehydrogenase family protein [Conexibacter sp. CPCC 206217]MDO8212536.1 acyl-CoA dehydrogenase family protein [Conexibacter sp. CPCC 206217]